jgi:hypothetical protein
VRKASTAAAIAITVFLAGGVVAQGALAQL